MKNVLELKDIAGYIPHDLKYICIGDESRTVSPILQRYKYEIFREFEKESVLPILRPLSDLYKIITHNGKEIVPIVECAKISIPNRIWFLREQFLAVTNRVSPLIPSLTFNFDKNILSFYVGGDLYTFAPKQVIMFDFLNELKIDYRGLIAFN